VRVAMIPVGKKRVIEEDEFHGITTHFMKPSGRSRVMSSATPS
jgi:hypothetical protein